MSSRQAKQAKNAGLALLTECLDLLSASFALATSLLKLVAVPFLLLGRWVQTASAKGSQAPSPGFQAAHEAPTASAPAVPALPPAPPVSGVSSRPHLTLVPPCPAPVPAPVALAPVALHSVRTGTGTEPGLDWQPPVEVVRPTIPAPPFGMQPTEPGETPAVRRPEKRAFALPPTSCLVPQSASPAAARDDEKLQAMGEKLMTVLSAFGVHGKVEDVTTGPVLTTFEVSPAPGTKVSKVAGIDDDLSLALGRKVRILAPIPGKSRLGFEMASDKPAKVALRDLIEDERFQDADGALPIVLGRDSVGRPVVGDLATMPHVIVSGATGSGKSVGLNVMLLSLLYRRTPAELRLLMIDPKVVELAPFEGIPHMLRPVVTDMEQAAQALQQAASEMDRRFNLFAAAGARNLASYNAGVMRAGRPADRLPSIVIVIEEYADLVMQQGKEVGDVVTRLAQKARAAGMHIILATQRPSTDVITGLIKANFPTRIAYRVSAGVDSRIILDEQGAENLLGKGDALVKIGGEMQRVQCPWVSEDEVNAVTSFLRTQGVPVTAPRAAVEARPAVRRPNLRVVGS
jgi:S-DNA-T family DNA segregation ATPase FtsK/SpoIIIE